MKHVSSYAIKGSVVNYRSGPETSHRAVLMYKDLGCYVSDYYLNTGNGYAAKKWSNPDDSPCFKPDDKPKPKPDGKPKPKPKSKPSDKPRASTGPMKDDYPCKGGSCSGVDKWNYYTCQCVSFVAWRINSRLGIDINNRYKGKRWDNTNEWDDAAHASGVTVNDTPKPGAVDQTSQGSRYRHVVWVAKVSGNSATIEEYNNRRHKHSTGTVPKSSKYTHLKK
ncbi:hypothetical protein DL89DRAFT_304297 [Linderina pennispora]|uniref:Peptidase C51 domain-containing protein n=1 Tax=Linderina pennispora TaxID=61395 RepID=A0A1Y1W0I7_9FUNG|nr:uncharacterized protein DL89DRAFT_304297 [Linderina pennispora]ORX67031.1 hypothetical protein DL89DRAFT_304297 [Linderina pennispora]